MSQTIATAAAGGANGTAENAAQYLTFVCAGEEYGVEILRVQEIKGWDGVTRVPYTPPYLLGVMNLRGVIVPIIDLRTRFGLEQRPFDASTVVIVVRVQSTRGEKTVGIVVDGVSEVYSIAREAVKETPELGGRASGACVKGLTTVDNKMVMLLDVERLVVSSVEADFSAEVLSTDGAVDGSA
jgi:purine-binding chemotaxis protein CheW